MAHVCEFSALREQSLIGYVVIIITIGE